MITTGTRKIGAAFKLCYIYKESLGAFDVLVSFFAYALEETCIDVLNNIFRIFHISAFADYKTGNGSAGFVVDTVEIFFDILVTSVNLCAHRLTSLCHLLCSRLNFRKSFTRNENSVYRISKKIRMIFVQYNHILIFDCRKAEYIARSACCRHISSIILYIKRGD